MKLVGLSILATLLLAAPAARADDDEVLNPPGGPVYVVSNPPARPMGPAGPGAGAQGPQGNGQRRAQVRQLRQALLQTFDVNGDGKLGPRERQHAIKVLRRMERKLAQRGGGGPQGAGPQGAGPQGNRRQMRMQKFIQRYDTNGDGNVGPGEMPPNAAKRMRRLDRNRDGWVSPGEIE